MFKRFIFSAVWIVVALAGAARAESLADVTVWWRIDPVRRIPELRIKGRDGVWREIPRSQSPVRLPIPGLPGQVMVQNGRILRLYTDGVYRIERNLMATDLVTTATSTPTPLPVAPPPRPIMPRPSPLPSTPTPLPVAPLPRPVMPRPSPLPSTPTPLPVAPPPRPIITPTPPETPPHAPPSSDAPISTPLTEAPPPRPAPVCHYDCSTERCSLSSAASGAFSNQAESSPESCQIRCGGIGRFETTACTVHARQLTFTGPNLDIFMRPEDVVANRRGHCAGNCIAARHFERFPCDPTRQAMPLEDVAGLIFTHSSEQPGGAPQRDPDPISCVVRITGPTGERLSSLEEPATQSLLGIALHHMTSNGIDTWHEPYAPGNVCAATRESGPRFFAVGSGADCRAPEATDHAVRLRCEGDTPFIWDPNHPRDGYVRAQVESNRLCANGQCWSCLRSIVGHRRAHEPSATVFDDLRRHQPRGSVGDRFLGTHSLP